MCMTLICNQCAPAGVDEGIDKLRGVRFPRFGKFGTGPQVALVLRFPSLGGTGPFGTEKMSRQE